MKKVLLIAVIAVAGRTSYGQETNLNTEKYAQCELFAQKSGYDWQQRISQMDSLENQEVTVFEVRGKDNKIKKTYSGKLKSTWKLGGKSPTKGDATVITVVQEQEGKGIAYFPLTNDKSYRIYLKGCLN